jgi:Zn-dependent peptidase ImmA (M78 family)
VVVNTRDYVPARIFTIFHELTHVVKGGGGLCLPEPQLARPTGSPTEEMFCNLVIGHLLVPTDALVAEASSLAIAAGYMATEERELKRLAARFKVSQQVIWYRLNEVGLVSLDAYRSRWAIWTSRPFEPRPHAESGSVPMISAAKRAVSETGRSVLGPMFEAYDRGVVGTADLIDWLDVHVEDLPNVEKLLREPTD